MPFSWHWTKWLNLKNLASHFINLYNTMCDSFRLWLRWIFDLFLSDGNRYEWLTSQDVSTSGRDWNRSVTWFNTTSRIIKGGAWGEKEAHLGDVFGFVSIQPHALVYIKQAIFRKLGGWFFFLIRVNRLDWCFTILYNKLRGGASLMRSRICVIRDNGGKESGVSLPVGCLYGSQCALGGLDGRAPTHSPTPRLVCRYIDTKKDQMRFYVWSGCHAASSWCWSRIKGKFKMKTELRAES